MKETEKIKEVVKEKYSLIAQGQSGSCCGGSPCCGGGSYTVFSDDYGTREGHVADADLGLGCGIPTDFAVIKPGEHILDLGSGAGNDCFVARGILGAEGSVTGLDFTEAMIKKARENNSKMGYSNVSFVQGDIEAMPFTDGQFDLIISNCVLNLVPDKSKAFSEIFRVLKKGGRISVSDVVLSGELPDSIASASEMYAGCVSGAMQKLDYLQIMESKGFQNIRIRKEKDINVPDDLLLQYATRKEIDDYRTLGSAIKSITVTAEKR